MPIHEALERFIQDRDNASLVISALEGFHAEMPPEEKQLSAQILAQCGHLLSPDQKVDLRQKLTNDDSLFHQYNAQLDRCERLGYAVVDVRQEPLPAGLAHTTHHEATAALSRFLQPDETDHPNRRFAARDLIRFHGTLLRGEKERLRNALNKDPDLTTIYAEADQHVSTHISSGDGYDQGPPPPSQQTSTDLSIGRTIRLNAMRIAFENAAAQVGLSLSPPDPRADLMNRGPPDRTRGL